MALNLKAAPLAATPEAPAERGVSVHQPATPMARFVSTAVAQGRMDLIRNMPLACCAEESDAFALKWTQDFLAARSACPSPADFARATRMAATVGKESAEVLYDRAQSKAVTAFGAGVISDLMEMERLCVSAPEMIGALRAKVDEMGGHVMPLGLQSYKSMLTMGRDSYLRSKRGLLDYVTTGYPLLDHEIGGFRRGSTVNIAARPGQGKAQPLDAGIKTVDGWTTFADVRVGDRLASVDGAESVVTGVFPQGTKRVYRVTLSDGRSTECCAEHLWEVRYRDWEGPRVVDTAKLVAMLGRVRYRNRLIVRQASGEFGASAPLPLDAWAVGAILGNGGLTQYTPRFSTVDPDTLARLTAALAPLGITMRFVAGCDYSMSDGFKGTENPLTARLRDLGLWGKLSHEKRIPSLYLAADRATRLGLMQGLLDTGGTAEKGGSVSFSTASEGLAGDVESLARSLGYWAKTWRKAAHVVNPDGTRDRKRDCFTVCLTGPRIAEVFSLPRKRARAANRRFFKSLTVASVVACGEKACACISVSHPSRLYVTDDYVVTHNTTYISHMAMSAHRAGANVLFMTNEMTDEDVALLQVGLRTRFNPMLVARAQIGLWGMAEFEAALEEEIARADDMAGFWLLEGGYGSKVGKVRSAIDRLKPDIVYVDASYLMRPDVEKKFGGKHEVLSDVEGAFRVMSIQTKTTIVKTIQLNREGDDSRKTFKDKDGRESKKPSRRKPMNLTELAGTDSAGQDATAVFGIRSGEAPRATTTRELHGLKNRAGAPLGGFLLNFRHDPPDFSMIGRLVEEDETSWADEED